jgi:hypothetical protein
VHRFSLAHFFQGNFELKSISGTPIAGTGAGLRPIGQDPNFAEDFREIFNISVPIHKDEDKIDQVLVFLK